MHYPWRDAFLDYVRRDITPSRFAGRTAGIRNMYDLSATPALMHLLGSHDTARIRTELGGSADRARLAAGLLLTATGAPLVYYGDEIGVEGGDDPGSRRCLEGGPTKHDRRSL